MGHFTVTLKIKINLLVGRGGGGGGGRIDTALKNSLEVVIEQVRLEGGFKRRLS